MRPKSWWIISGRTLKKISLFKHGTWDFFLCFIYFLMFSFMFYLFSNVFFYVLFCMFYFVCFILYVFFLCFIFYVFFLCFLFYVFFMFSFWCFLHVRPNGTRQIISDEIRSFCRLGNLNRLTPLGIMPVPGSDLQTPSPSHLPQISPPPKSPFPRNPHSLQKWPAFSFVAKDAKYFETYAKTISQFFPEFSGTILSDNFLSSCR